MLKTYREEMRIQTCHCDLTGQWRPSAILEAMQETAGVHSELLGVGRNALIQQGVVWVLTRLEVVMDRYPKIAETISIETFPMPVRRWFFPRYLSSGTPPARRSAGPAACGCCWTSTPAR